MNPDDAPLCYPLFPYVVLDTFMVHPGYVGRVWSRHSTEEAAKADAARVLDDVKRRHAGWNGSYVPLIVRELVTAIAVGGWVRSDDIAIPRYPHVVINTEKAEAEALVVEQRLLRLLLGGAHVAVLRGRTGAKRCGAKGVTTQPTVDQLWDKITVDQRCYESAEDVLVEFADGTSHWFPIADLEDLEVEA
jgi:hypothetical protein